MKQLTFQEVEKKSQEVEKAIPKELQGGNYITYECECKQDLVPSMNVGWHLHTVEERRAFHEEWIEDVYCNGWQFSIYKKCPNCKKIIDWDKCWRKPTRKIFCMYYDNKEKFDEYKNPSKKALECWERYKKTKGVDYECFIDAERGRVHEPRPVRKIALFI